MRAPLIAAIALALSCGGADHTFTPITTSGTLAAGFSGTWTGPTTITFQGLSPVSYTGQIVVSVNGGAATVSRVCPDGSGSILANGDGQSATWSGSLACPGVVFGGCDSVSVTYQSASLTLGNNGAALTAQAAGSGTGCGSTRTLALTFNGTH